MRRLNQANTNRAERMTRERLTLSADQIATITRDVRFVNQLAEKRAFSWSRLLADLETTIPHIWPSYRSIELSGLDRGASRIGGVAARHPCVHDEFGTPYGVPACGVSQSSS